MPLIGVAGDIHGALTKWYRWVEEWQQRTGHKLDALIHVGDFGIYEAQYTSDFIRYWYGERKARIPTYVCPGNHEQYSMIEEWQKTPDRIPNMHLLSDGAITNVCGMKVGAVWGNFSYKSWLQEERITMARRNHHDSNKAMHIRKSSVYRLKEAGKFDCLITHDCPAKIMKVMRPMDEGVKAKLGLDRDEPRAQGCYGFNELYETGKPQYHFFGHFHTYYVCQEKNPLVVCLHCFNYKPEDHFWVIEWNADLEDGLSIPAGFNVIPVERRVVLT